MRESGRAQIVATSGVVWRVFRAEVFVSSFAVDSVPGTGSSACVRVVSFESACGMLAVGLGWCAEAMPGVASSDMVAKGDATRSDASGTARIASLEGIMGEAVGGRRANSIRRCASARLGDFCFRPERERWGAPTDRATLQLEATQQLGHTRGRMGFAIPQ